MDPAGGGRLTGMARSRNGEDPELEQRSSGDDAPNPVWFKPLMIGFMLLGLLWVLVFYISGTLFPIPGIKEWNLIIGFGIAFIGFLMTTRWR
jgi:hypothetical protein